MSFIICLVILLSTVFSSNLKNWIDKNSTMIEKDIYKIEFLYSINKDKTLTNINRAEYYSLNSDSSIIKIDDRIILCSDEKWEIIDKVQCYIIIINNHI